MKDETFRKVYIKSVDDLPKNGEYDCSTKDGLSAKCIYEENPTFETFGKTWWIRNVDWYLQPIKQSEQEQKLTASINDIKEWLSNNGIGTGTNITVNSVAHLIQEFIAQWVHPPAEQKAVEITDQDITPFTMPKISIKDVSCVLVDNVQKGRIDMISTNIVSLIEEIIESAGLRLVKKSKDTITTKEEYNCKDCTDCIDKTGFCLKYDLPVWNEVTTEKSKAVEFCQCKEPDRSEICQRCNNHTY